jgi:hypothetical protein
MKYVITESQYNRLLENDDDYLSRWISDDTYSRILRNFDKLEKINCDDVDMRSYDTPIHISTFCKYLRGKSFKEINRLYDMASMRAWDEVSNANDEFVKSMGIDESFLDWFKSSKSNDEEDRFTCSDCGEKDYSMYMVNDDIWDKHGNDKLTLCKSCLEKRMGRKLTKKDISQYKDVLVNIHNPEIKDL